MKILMDKDFSSQSKQKLCTDEYLGIEPCLSANDTPMWVLTFCQDKQAQQAQILNEQLSKIIPWWSDFCEKYEASIFQVDTQNIGVRYSHYSNGNKLNQKIYLPTHERGITNCPTVSPVQIELGSPPKVIRALLFTQTELVQFCEWIRGGIQWVLKR